MSSLRFAIPSIVLCVLLFHVAPFRTAEVTSFDLRLKGEAWLRPVPQSPEILLIGIDDDSLMNFGRWPWPRHYWDDIIEALGELGARAVLIDVAFREPAESFVEPHPGDDPFEESLDNLVRRMRESLSGESLRLSLGPSASETVVVSAAASVIAQSMDVLTSEIRALMPAPDRLLSQALADVRARGVLVAGLCTVMDIAYGPEAGRAKARIAARRWLVDHAGSRVDDLPPELKEPLSGQLDELALFGRLHELLDREPNANLASGFTPGPDGPVPIPPDLVRYGQENADRVRVLVIEDRVRRVLASFGSKEVRSADLKQHPRIAPLMPLGRLTETVIDQVLARRSIAARLGRPVHGLEHIRALPWGATLVPPVASISKELDVIGADNEVKDADGLLRSTTLFWQADDLVVPAAALGLYLELLRRRPGASNLEAVVRPGPVLEIAAPVERGPASTVRVPLTPSGQCIIHWAGKWEDAFAKLSLGSILSYAGIQKERERHVRARIGDNAYAMSCVFGEIARDLRLSRETGPLGLADLARRVEARRPGVPVQVERFLEGNVPGRPASVTEQRSPGEWCRFFSDLRKARETQVFESDRAGLERVKTIKDPVRREARRKLYAKVERAYGRYVTELEGMRQSLAKKIDGRICFIGDVSSSSTDLAPMPFEQKYPKLGSHANLLNTLLSGRFVTRPAGLGWSLGGLVDPEYLQFPILLLVSIVMAIALANLSTVQGARLALLFMVTWVVFATAILTWYGIWLDVVCPLLATTVTYVTVFTWRSRRTENIRRMFETYVDPRIVSVLVENESLWKELGGREQEITAFFSDIAGFTTISELLDPQELSEMLTAYLSPMTEVILRRGGTRDKYIGDAIVAFFGAPLITKDHALQACLAAIEQQETLVELKKRWKADGVPWYLKLLEKGKDIEFRIGLNTGRAKVGNFGAQRSKNYTMIGDTVNLASRLEGANKAYGTRVMASEATVAFGHGSIVVRELDRVVVKGKVEAVRVYEVVGRKGEVAPAVEESLAAYTAALGLYHAREFARARDGFAAILAARPDGPSAEYVKRCESYLLLPPPADWDGAFVMKEK